MDSDPTRKVLLFSNSTPSFFGVSATTYSIFLATCGIQTIPAKSTADEAVAYFANEEDNEGADQDHPADGQQAEGDLVQNPDNRRRRVLKW